MARLDYWKIRTNMLEVFEGDALLNGVNFGIENRVQIASERCPWVNIRMERRDAEDDEQVLAAGQRVVYSITIILDIKEYSLESSAEAIRARDDLISRVEVVLMKNRKLLNYVDNLWLQGGVMDQAEADKGYISTGEIVVMVRAKNLTT